VQTWFWPPARVVHHQSHSTEPAFGGEPFELLASTRRDVIARRLGRRRASLDDVCQALTFATRILAKRALRRTADREQRQLRALIHTRREPDPPSPAGSRE
jgi:hypothetical protein